MWSFAAQSLLKMIVKESYHGAHIIMWTPFLFMVVATLAIFFIYVQMPSLFWRSATGYRWYIKCSVYLLRAMN